MPPNVESTSRGWRPILVALAVCLPAASVSGVIAATVSAPPLVRTRSTPGRIQPGKELIFIVVGSSYCRATHTPGYTEAVVRAQAAVAREAARTGERVVVIGVALDPSIRDGFRFLSHFPGFDEVMVGRNWLNLGSAALLEGHRAVPQLLVVRRTVTVEAGRTVVRAARIERRVIGVDSIRAWAGVGAPIRPGLSTAVSATLSPRRTGGPGLVP